MAPPTDAPANGAEHGLSRAVDGSSISIIIPARDEAPRLENTLAEVFKAAPKYFATLEVIIVDDGSVDETPAIADRLAARFPEVSVVHLPYPHGLGGAFKAGLARATMEYATVVHGDGGTPAGELEKIWALRGRADLIIPYPANNNERPGVRVLISDGFRKLVNGLFRTRLHCLGHFVLYRRQLIQSVRLRTDSHAFQAEALIKLLRAGCSYVEVPVLDEFESQAPTRSYQPGNVIRVAWFLVATFFDVYVSRDARRSLAEHR